MAVTAMGLGNVPNLPGFGYKKRQARYHKSQVLAVINGIRVEQAEGVTFDRPKFVSMPAAPDERRWGEAGDTTMHEHYRDPQARPDTRMPAWDALDRHVLRFWGFFKEAVVEANMENFRVRHCVVFYHLEDDTCLIAEKKQDNSGMPQGTLLRRHRFPNQEGGYLTWQDLQVGGVLNIYGRSIQLIDCDVFTRSFYEREGMDQGLPMSAEEDAFSVSQVKSAGPFGVAKTYERQYREVMLGGGHVNADMQQFLEWDRKVCRFYAVVDDVSLPQFERRPFVLLYFLADDTVEIREQYPLNSGRDNFPIFYRRNKIARGSVQVRGPLDQAKPKKDFIAAEDFAVGRVTELMGKRYFVYDADPFTRQYYREELGFTLAPAEDVRLPERTVPRPKTPPYTGYGSWEDSLGSIHQLMPKPPRRDMVKIFANEGKVLRWTAQFYQAKPQDSDRHFVFNYHLADDTVSIHEPPQRNQGIVTGKFLEKGVHLNQISGTLFTVADLFPGAVVKVYNREFEIMDMDEYTRKYVESGGSGTQNFDLTAVLEKLREGMRQQFPLARDIFRRFDADHDGVLTLAEFTQALTRWSFHLSDKEVSILMRHFDKRQDGQISYNEFCDALLDEDYTSEMMKLKPPLHQDYDEGYAEKARQKQEERAETEKVRAAVRAIGDTVYKHTGAFHRLFKEFGYMTHEPTVTSEQIVTAMAAFGHTFSLEDVERCVLHMLPGANLKKIKYVDYLKAMVTSYHDSAATR